MAFLIHTYIGTYVRVLFAIASQAIAGDWTMGYMEVQPKRS